MQVDSTQGAFIRAGRRRAGGHSFTYPTGGLILLGMSELDDVLSRAAGWQAKIESRDVDGIREFMHEDYSLALVVPAEATVPLDERLRMLPDYVVHRYDDSRPGGPR